MFKIESHANGKIDGKLAALYRDLATARAEAAALHDKLSYATRGSKIVRRAVVDAHSILLAAFSNESTSIKAMAERGVTKRRWAWAVAFLRYAGIVSSQTRNWRNGLEFLVTAWVECVALLENAARELLESAAGYKTLARHLRDA